MSPRYRPGHRGYGQSPDRSFYPSRWCDRADRVLLADRDGPPGRTRERNHRRHPGRTDPPVQVRPRWQRCRTAPAAAIPEHKRGHSEGSTHHQPNSTPEAEDPPVRFGEPPSGETFRIVRQRHHHGLQRLIKPKDPNPGSGRRKHEVQHQGGAHDDAQEQPWRLSVRCGSRRSHGYSSAATAAPARPPAATRSALLIRWRQSGGRRRATPGRRGWSPRSGPSR